MSDRFGVGVDGSGGGSSETALVVYHTHHLAYSHTSDFVFREAEVPAAPADTRARPSVRCSRLLSLNSGYWASVQLDCQQDAAPSSLHRDIQ